MTAVVEEVEFSSEAHAAFRQFGAYANYRAIPDARDGLKPGARRTLFAMFKQGYTPERKTVKAMAAIGDTLKFHPHGDSGQYTTMVTMAHSPESGEPVKRLVPMLHGQGSWGDLDFAAAAARYTECKLNPMAMLMLGVGKEITGGAPEIDENGVEMMLNYSGDKYEPTVLPSLWPSFVVNGNEGIGAGVSMDAASHNIVEVLNLAVKMVDSPNMRFATAMQLLPGPDMPCSADIFDTDDGGIERYFTTGYGAFVMRAQYTVEEYKISARKVGRRIVVTGLPYRVSPAKCVAGIRSMVDTADLPNDITVTNSTSAENGTRIVVDIVENDLDDTLQRLLFFGTRSRMQERFSVQAHAVADGRIRAIGPIEGVRLWIDHRRSVVRRRTRYRLERAEDRLEIVIGYLKLIPIAEQIVKLIRTSDNRADATSRMVNGDPLIGKTVFTERQAIAILDVTLSRLTKLGLDEYLDEKSELEALIAECNELLSDARALDNRLKREMRAVRDQYGVDRRCRLRLDESATVARPETPAIEIPAKPGYVVRTGGNWLRWATKRSVSKIVGNDHVVAFDRVTDQNVLEAVSSMGYQYRKPVADLPERMTKADGLFRLDQGERLILASSSAAFGDPDLVLVTRTALLKRLNTDTFRAAPTNGKEKQLIPLGEDDVLDHAFFLPAGADIALVSAYGRMLKIDSDTITSKGRSAAGNPAMRLDDGDSIVWAGAVTDATQLVYWTDAETVGWLRADQIAYNSRNTKGEYMTRSKNVVAGVAVGAGAELRWFGAGLDDPASLALTGASGPSITDRAMNPRVAKGVKRAAAVWVETGEPESE